MLRKPAFWALFAAASVACAAFAVVNFPRAFSMVELDLEMDRAGALAEARRLADELDWGPTDYRQAASFRVDDRVRSFVELEGGGAEAFQGLLREGPFHPYQWIVPALPRRRGTRGRGPFPSGRGPVRLPRAAAGGRARRRAR